MPMGSLNANMMPPMDGSMPPQMAAPGMGAAGMLQGPPTEQPPDQSGDVDTLAEVGKSAKEYLDVLMPIAVPEDDDDRPVPKQIQCLENGTDIFRMFDVDPNRFDYKACKKGYHKLAQYVHPEKIGRKPTPADEAR